MALELPKIYESGKYESEIYQRWEESGYFNPDKTAPWAEGLSREERRPFTIMLPLPNANAPLHVGHALGLTVQDILTRFNRMRGRRALWLPGTDHAGFETQVVFEKKLEKAGTSRFQMTREEFYKACWDFVQENKHLSEEGIRRLGASCDWSRNIFSLDPEIVKVVYETFGKMFQDGLIYRGNRICNWCPKHQTGLADLETKYEERVEPFFYFKYGPFTIGTSRPETKFGDKYVVMHPDDKRYTKYKHGDKLDLEWINGPITATIIKDSAAEMDFGTGVMTITPAHSGIDFEIAERHNLDIEQVIDKRGKMLPMAGEFSGLKILEARAKIVEKLESKGLVEKIDANYKHNVQLCYKCSSLIEPQIVPQWYIKMTASFTDSQTKKERPSLRDMAVAAVDKGAVTIVTERFEKTFRHWMDNIRDWPISRQIWWGIPIPVKYCGACSEIIVDTKNDLTKCPKCSSDKLTADADTFDTWFSSGQWPYATLLANDAKKIAVGQPAHDFDTYFPTQVMETGWDILFFWVARMVMLSYYRTEQPPFANVFLHGLVRDKDRQKMSKSKGNVIDPLGVIDTYGCDALRFALIFSTAAGNDIPLAEDKIKGMKHFANKLWNIARYVITNVEVSDSTWENKTEADKIVNSELESAVIDATKHIEEFRLHEAAQIIYDFVWHKLADVYVEATKEQLANSEIKHNTQKILLHQLIIVLKLLHPFMPFVTEVIWQELGARSLVSEKLLLIAPWPTVDSEPIK